MKAAWIAMFFLIAGCASQPQQWTASPPAAIAGAQGESTLLVGLRDGTQVGQLRAANGGVVCLESERFAVRSCYTRTPRLDPGTNEVVGYEMRMTSLELRGR